MDTCKTIAHANIENIGVDLTEMMAGRLSGLVITDVLPDDILQFCVTNIKKTIAFNTFQTYDILEDDFHLGTVHTLEEYLQKAVDRQPGYNEMLGFDPDELFISIFKKLTTLPAEIPKFKQKSYKGTVVKAFKKDQRFLPHTDRLSVNLSQYQHLFEIADFDKELSFVLILQSPDVGGDFITYDLNWYDTPPQLQLLSTMKMQLMEQYLEQRHNIQHKVPSVDSSLLIFPGGNQWHKVSPIVGEKWRITIGGFMAPDLVGERLYFWS